MHGISPKTMSRALALLALVLVALPCSAFDFQRGSGPFRHYHFNHSGTVSWPVTPTFEWTFSQDPSGATVTTDSGHVMTKVGAPTRKTDGTWPSGLDGSQGYAYDFDGASDYFSRADDGTFDPAGDFSVCAVVTPDTISGEQYIASKWGGTGRGWRLYLYDDGVRFAVSVDGGAVNASTLTKGSSVAIGRPSLVCASYDYVSDEHSIANVWVDGLTVASSNTFRGPAYDTDASLTTGAHADAGGLFDGSIHYLAYFDGTVLTASDIARAQAQWRGLVSGSGGAVTVSSASPPMQMVAPPDSGTEPFFVPMPANTWQVGSPATGRGGVSGVAALTNYVQRGTLETWAGSASGGCSDYPSGWSIACTAGDGTSDMASDTSCADGAKSAKLTLTGASSSAQLISPCMTDGIGSDLYFSAMMKGTAATEQMDFAVYEYDSAACATFLQIDYIANDLNAGTSWEQVSGKIASGDWHADTSSYKVYLIEAGNGGVTTYVDSIYAGPVDPGDWYCGADTSATAVCTSVVPSHDSPLSADGSVTVRLTASSPWAGTELGANAYILSDGPYGSANTLTALLFSNTDEPYFGVDDSTGDPIYIFPNVLNWAASTDYTLEFFRDTSVNPAQLGLWWNSAWNETEGGAGTGHHSAAQSTIYFGGSGTTGSNVWLRDVEFFRGVRK